VTAVARSLDDLDRLAFRLSRTIRTQYPQLLGQGFTLSDLEERLLPYRDVRREMANGGTDAFETALLRLVAGDRGYLVSDPELQGACRQALAFPSPTLAMVRAWATSTLRLSQANAGTSGSAVAIAASQTMPMAGMAEHDLFPAPSHSHTPASTPSGLYASGTAPAVAHSCCRFCDNKLPQGRKITFCPYCGMDLTKRQCPACSTELEVSWRYCVTCGREE
jgi:hypothetical protein